MKATLPFIEEQYCRFNNLCFDTLLPEVEFHLSRARTYLGRMEYRQGRYLIRISTAFELPQETVEDVLLHEMIHVWLHFAKVRQGRPHGRCFRSKMEEINSRFGRHVTIRYKMEGEAAPQRKQRSKHFICISTFPNGSRGITVMAEANIPRITRALARRYNLKSRELFESTDPYFNRYPLSRKAVIYKIEDEKLNQILGKE